ncbi:MAG TPA: hypothetical protein VFF65_10655 [Phycisphaerales bacterium]|nr:hypothetical protein [Phycisphaerales bacterium]
MDGRGGEENATPAVDLLWFETPSEINEAMTSVSGWTTIGAAADRYGVERRRVWPLNVDGSTADAGLHMQPELERAFEHAGWRADDDDEQAADRLAPGVFALTSCYTLLLVLNGLPRAAFAGLRDPGRTLGVTFGWATGDIEPVGGLTGGRWGPLPRIKHVVVRSSASPTGIEFYNARKYLARGGAANWRDTRTGESFLHKMSFPSLRDVKALVEAGADINAVDRKGVSVLHKLADLELPMVRYLLKQGANVKAVDKEGKSVVDHAMHSGLCTAAHLELLTRAGGRPRASRPFVELADDGYSKERGPQLEGLIRFWSAFGEDPSRADSRGVPPLWVALKRHADELGAVLFGETEKDGWWYVDRNNHDRVAELLLKAGADANARLVSGNGRWIPKGATPLMVRRYSTDRLVRALLSHGADPHARCAKGKTALEYAREASKTPQRPGHEGAAKVARLLELAMAAPPKRRKKSR